METRNEGLIEGGGGRVERGWLPQARGQEAGGASYLGHVERRQAPGDAPGGADAEPPRRVQVVD